MSFTRSIENPPKYYEQLPAKKKRSWRRTTRKMERNENLHALYPPFRTSSDINIIHIHYQSTIPQIDELISTAKQTKRYVLDTESQKGEEVNKGALIQVQFIHSINNSTIILIEAHYLPDRQSTLFKKIKELCAVIFNNNNEIITWGLFADEFKYFHHLDLINTGKIKTTNLQFLFSNPNNDSKTHPIQESRDDENREVHMRNPPGDNDYVNIFNDDDDDDELVYNINPVQDNSIQPISLQNAIATTFKKFLDKSLTVNYWKCGLDLNLNTWTKQLFSKNGYNEETEKQQRQVMKQYAIDDCTSLAELFFHMYPEKIMDYQTPPETPKATSNVIFQMDNDLSEISEDELIELLKPKFNKKPQILNQSNSSNEQPPQVHVQRLKLSKAEKQKKKNEKYKWKKQNNPNFNLKIKRPIYYKYDYKKVRAQLRDDDVHHSHQIKINNKLDEVMIGFTSQEELERAKKIVRINYFSKLQYMDRWNNF